MWFLLSRRIFSLCATHYTLQYYLVNLQSGFSSMMSDTTHKGDMGEDWFIVSCAMERYDWTNEDGAKDDYL